MTNQMRILHPYLCKELLFFLFCHSILKVKEIFSYNIDLQMFTSGTMINSSSNSTFKKISNSKWQNGSLTIIYITLISFFWPYSFNMLTGCLSTAIPSLLPAPGFTANSTGISKSPLRAFKAAFFFAIILLAPTPSSKDLSPTITLHKNVFLWSGPKWGRSSYAICL